MSMLRNQRVAALFMAQCNAASRRQLRDVGVTDRQIDRAGGLLTRPAPGVYALASSPPSFGQDLWVARLACDVWAAVAFEAAARVQGLATFAGHAMPTLLVPHGAHHRVCGAVVHQTRDPWLVSVEVIDGLLVTTVPRTICDLARVARPGRLSLVLDDAKVAKKATYEEVGLELASIARRGKPGVALLRELLDERGPGHLPPIGKLERQTLTLYDMFGGAPLQVAWPDPGREQVNGCADFGDPEALLAVETDGRRWHDRIADAKRDRERDANAARHGVQVLRVLYEHVVGDPRGTWQLIEDTRAIRRQQLRGTAAA